MTLERELTRVKYKAFGKVSYNKKPRTERKVNKLTQKKYNLITKKNDAEIVEEELVEIDKEIYEAVNEVNKRSIDKSKAKLRNLKETKGRAAAVFNLKKSILGSSISSREPYIVIDPNTGIEVMTPTEIKRLTLKYCVSLLTNREPKDLYYEHIQRKKQLHWLRMNEVIENDINELSMEMFVNSLNILAKKPGG